MAKSILQLASELQTISDSVTFRQFAEKTAATISFCHLEKDTLAFCVREPGRAGTICKNAVGVITHASKRLRAL
jgi:hypothetical protein